jgi:hypothetical protein
MLFGQRGLGIPPLTNLNCSALLRAAGLSLAPGFGPVLQLAVGLRGRFSCCGITPFLVAGPAMALFFDCHDVLLNA